MVKRLRHRPFTAVTRVRVPVGSPNENVPDRERGASRPSGTFLFVIPVPDCGVGRPSAEAAGVRCRTESLRRRTVTPKVQTEKSNQISKDKFCISQDLFSVLLTIRRLPEQPVWFFKASVKAATLSNFPPWCISAFLLPKKSPPMFLIPERQEKAAGVSRP